MADAGLPYVGSVMSLVTHGEVRYEGILSHVDMSNSSITLSNVRCFGTEGRIISGQQIPSSDQVFQTVVFKGAEIKELTVLQPPPTEPAPYAPPAETSSLGASPWGTQPSQPSTAAPAFGSNPWSAAPPTATSAASQPTVTAPPPPSDKPTPARAPTVAVASVSQHANGAPKPRPTSYAHAAGGTSVSGGRGSGRGGLRGRGGAPRGRGRGGYQHHQQQHQPAPPMTIPAEEFDFEEALKRFDKDKVLEEANKEDTTTDAAKTKYKKDDFFDEISCEALEKLTVADAENIDRRGRMAAQRRTDVETFGSAARGRGPGGRGRGRGPARGRGRGGRSQPVSQ